MRRLGMAFAVLVSPVSAQDLPSLPSGLSGINTPVPTASPVLPAGLENVALPAPDGDVQTAPNSNITTTGFVDLRYGQRLTDDPLQGGETLSEVRLHFDVEALSPRLRFSADLVADSIDEATRGEGTFDLREANWLARPSAAIDVRVGRQILTWGTGDLVFINDVFPKDYVSFFAGRSDDYLKSPSDAIRLSYYNEVVNFDVVVMSAQNVDRSIDGERFTFTDGATSALRGADDPFESDLAKGAEYALRAYRTFGAYEVAGYGYSGHWKSPMGTDPVTGRGFYPNLTVYGASLRGPLAGGIVHAEAGFYDSRDDRTGKNPFIANSEARVLVGFEREVASQTTLGVQYYAAFMQEYDAYLDAAPTGSLIKDEVRDLVTLRLTTLALNQKLTLSAFGFYSPEQNDRYLRLTATYKPSDAVTLSASFNDFGGDADTPLGQFETGSNFGLGLRYSF